MKLTDLTAVQLERLYDKAHAKLTRQSGTGHWDWPTLKMLYPGWAVAMLAIQAAYRAKVKESVL